MRGIRGIPNIRNQLGKELTPLSKTEQEMKDTMNNTDSAVVVPKKKKVQIYIFFQYSRVTHLL